MDEPNRPLPDPPGELTPTNGPQESGSTPPPQPVEVRPVAGPTRGDAPWSPWTPDELPPPPEPPVASRAAKAIWILAVPAMLPLLGLLPGLAMGTVAAVLLTRRDKLAHDRRVGIAGLVLAVLAMVFGTLNVGTLALAALARKPAETTTAESRPAAQPEDDAAPGADQGDTAPEPSGDHSDPNEAAEDDLDAAASPRPADVPTSPADLSAQLDAAQPLLPDWVGDAMFYAFLLLSIIFHEIGHGVAAYWSGDPTARNHGRFSLNPIRHLEWFGSVILPLALVLMKSGFWIGWAKPVPVDTRRLRHWRLGNLGVSLAGVSLNLLLALIGTHLLTLAMLAMGLYSSSAAIHLKPTEPSGVPAILGVQHAAAWAGVIAACKGLIWVNLILACFNLMPIPPLDGFHVIRALAPRFLQPRLAALGRFGMVILILLVVSGALRYALYPAVFAWVQLLSAAFVLSGFTSP